MRVLAHQPEVHHHGREDIVEIVRHASGQLADGFQFLRLKIAVLTRPGGLFRPDALEGAAAVVGQSLQDLQILRRKGVGPVAVERKNADNLGVPVDRHVHDRPRGTTQVAEGHRIRPKGLVVVPKNQLRALLQDPAGPRCQLVDHGRHIPAHAVDRIHTEHRIDLTPVVLDHVQRGGIPLPESVGRSEQGAARAGGVGCEVQLAAEGQQHLAKGLQALPFLDVLHHHDDVGYLPRRFGDG